MRAQKASRAAWVARRSTGGGASGTAFCSSRRTVETSISGATGLTRKTSAQMVDVEQVLVVFQHQDERAGAPKPSSPSMHHSFKVRRATRVEKRPGDGLRRRGVRDMK